MIFDAVKLDTYVIYFNVCKETCMTNFLNDVAPKTLQRTNSKRKLQEKIKNFIKLNENCVNDKLANLPVSEHPDIDCVLRSTRHNSENLLPCLFCSYENLHTQANTESSHKDSETKYKESSL